MSTNGPQFIFSIFFKNISNPNSGQYGSVGKHNTRPCVTTTKILTRLQNKYHPDSSENQAVWKSDNQGLKAATVIHTGRRGGNTDTQGGTKI